jgi:hypothetical protein
MPSVNDGAGRIGMCARPERALTIDDGGFVVRPDARTVDN